MDNSDPKTITNPCLSRVASRVVYHNFVKIMFSLLI